MKLVFFKDGLTMEEVGSIIGKKLGIVEYGEEYIYIPTPGYVEPVIYNTSHHVTITDRLSIETKTHIIETFIDNYEKISKIRECDNNLDERKTYLLVIYLLVINNDTIYDSNIEIDTLEISDKTSSDWNAMLDLIVYKRQDCWQDYYVLIRSNDHIINDDVDKFKENLRDCDYDINEVCYEYNNEVTNYTFMGTSDNIRTIVAIESNDNYGVFDTIKVDETIPRLYKKPNCKKPIIILNNDMITKIQHETNPFSDIQIDNCPILIADSVSNLNTKIRNIENLNVVGYMNDFRIENDGNIHCCLSTNAINTLRFIAFINNSQLFINRIPITKDFKLNANTVEEFYEIIEDALGNEHPGKIEIQIMRPSKHKGFTTIAEIEPDFFNSKSIKKVIMFVDEFITVNRLLGTSNITLEGYEINQVK